MDNFERLFSKLKEMKDKAATLPHEQRKLHAEKVAKAFWMAIGETEMKLKASRLMKNTKSLTLGSSPPYLVSHSAMFFVAGFPNIM